MMPSLAFANHDGCGCVACDSIVGAYGTAGDAVSNAPSPQSVRSPRTVRRKRFAVTRATSDVQPSATRARMRTGPVKPGHWSHFARTWVTPFFVTRTFA